MFGYPPQILPGGLFLDSADITTGFAFLRLPPPDPNCETAFMHMFCLAALPPCNNATGLLLPICDDSCSAFNRLVEQRSCDSVIQSAEQFLFSPTNTIFQPVFRVVIEFDCRNVSTYYFLEDVQSHLDHEKCTDLLTPVQTGKPLYMYAYFKQIFVTNNF